MLAWGYQPEFYDNSPLTRADLDPISNGHPIFIENLSMHIYYANSRAFEIAGVTDSTTIPGIIKKDGKPTGEIQEIEAALAFVAKLPPLDAACSPRPPGTRASSRSAPGSRRSPISPSAASPAATRPTRPSRPIRTFPSAS